MLGFIWVFSFLDEEGKGKKREEEEEKGTGELLFFSLDFPMGCFGCSKKSSKRSETNKGKNNDTVKIRKTVGGTSVGKSDKRDDQTQPTSGME